MGLLWGRKGRNARKEPPSFAQCPSCSYDFLSGEGTRSCSYGACPYLPEALNVLCPSCNYNFATGEGGRRCSELASCPYAEEGRAHAVAARKRFG